MENEFGVFPHLSPSLLSPSSLLLCTIQLLPVLQGPSNPTSVMKLLIIVTCIGWSPAFYPGGFQTIFSSGPSLTEKPHALLVYKTEKGNAMPIRPTPSVVVLLPCIDPKLHSTHHPALFSSCPMCSQFMFWSPQQNYKIPKGKNDVLTSFLSLVRPHTVAESVLSAQGVFIISSAASSFPSLVDVK